MKLCVKFCGGCNPRYDRGGIVLRLQKELPGLDVTYDTAEQADAVAVICGCSAACADHNDLDAPGGKMVISNDGSYAALEEFIRKLHK